MHKNFFHTEKLSEHLIAIWSACGEVLYYIQGEKRGLLMDTNLGVGHLKELVDSMARTPYDVVLTHGHVDHALGAAAFEKVYMNEADIPIYKAMSPMEERLGYLQACLGDSFKDYGFTEDDFILPTPDYAFTSLTDGMVFDLGGITVEMIAFPGHTPGSMALFLPELRILITGDACNDSTFLFDENASSVEEYLFTVTAVRERLSGRYDRVLICHHAVDTGSDLLENMAEVCKDILEGKADDLPFPFRGMTGYIAKACSPQFQRTDGKCANLIYNKSHMFKAK